MIGAEALTARVERLSGEVAAHELDALLIDEHFDLRYVTGYTGSNGLALVRADPQGPHDFLTDFRYTSQAEAEVLGPFRRRTVTGELRDALPGLLEGRGRLGFDESKLTVQGHRRLSEQLPEGWELIAAGGLVAPLRAVKEAAEVEMIRAACALADTALQETLEGGLVGRTEREVALDLETRMRRLGAEQPSFPSIVAAGAHGALPHAQPRAEPIPAGVLVTIDWGAVLDGYCSDCTRTYATGENVSGLARDSYELVLAAQLRGLEVLRAGPSGREVDGAAREVIAAAGQEERFGHGLGHGVGLEVHEPPRLSKTAPEEPLVAGNVVSVEPGVYLPGELGVRIEDLAAVTAEGNIVLTGLPKELTVVP